jgi:uncharacterized coiled-coil protein SlyX
MKLVESLKDKFWAIPKIETYLQWTKTGLMIWGVISIFLWIYTLGIDRPMIIRESEKRVDSLNVVIKTNKRLIITLEKENREIEDRIENLNGELVDLKKKSDKYQKEYEKQVKRIDALDDNELVKLFTESFK